MPQPPTHGSSLTVLGGPLDGTTYALGTSFEELLVGSDPGCHVHVDLPGVSPVHANLLVEAAGVTVRDTRSPQGLFVNDDRVTQPTRLRDSDILWLGAPGAPTSVMLLCKVVVLAPPVSVPVAGAADDGFFIESDLVSAPPSAEPAFELAEAPAADEVFFVDGAVDAPMPAAPAPAPAATSDDDVFFVADEPAPAAAPVAAPTAPVAAARPSAPAPLSEEPFLLDLAEPSSAAAPRATPPVDAFVLDLPGDTPAQGLAPARPAPAPPAEAALEFFVDDMPAAVPAPVVPRAAPPPAAAPSAPKAPAPANPVTVPVAPVAPVRPRTAAPPSGAPVAPSAPAAPRVARDAPPRPPAPAPAPVAPARAPAPPSTAARVPVEPRPRAPRTPSPTPVARPAARPAARAAGGSRRGLLLGVGAAVVLGLSGAGFAAWLWLQTPRLDGVTPARARAGEVVRLSGARFSKTSRALFGGQAGRIVKAEANLLEVELPELALTPGADRPISVVVQNGTRTSATLTLQGYVAPRLHGIAPDVALPGEVVELAGSAFGPDAQVTFGTMTAEVLARSTDLLRVRVPALDGPPGSAAPARVSVKGVTSNEAPFYVGRLPLVLSVKPQTAAAGDVVSVSGRGFGPEPGATQVRVGGRPALLLSVRADALELIVPWGVTGGVALEVQVAGQDVLAQSTLDVAAPTSGIDFRFVAEVLDEAPDGSLAAVATELGPAFVLAGSDGRTAAQRAHDAQLELNRAAVAVKASLAAEFEARFTEPPSIGLRGKSEAVLTATAADAAAYTSRGSRPVSPARLTAWWSAVARDLVLLLVRSERPQQAAALAGEGRALGDVFQAGRRLVPFGLPREVAASKGLRAALRGLALRVPNGVPEPALQTAGAPSAAAALRLDGTWSGREDVPEGRRSIAVGFAGRGGTFSLEGGLSLSVPLQSVERVRADGVRFAIRMAGGMRHYVGRWDGSRLRGEVSSDAAGRERLGTFELAPR